MDISAMEKKIDAPSGSLWLPGIGVSGTDERAAAAAVEEYDPNLVLGQRRDTGEWIVFLRKGPNDGEPFPVLGLGTRLPAADEVTRTLYQKDVRRHGEKLFHDIYRKQQANLKTLRDNASEASGVLAEGMEWGFRKQGVHPSPRVFLPAGVKSVKEE